MRYNNFQTLRIAVAMTTFVRVKSVKDRDNDFVDVKMGKDAQIHLATLGK